MISLGLIPNKNAHVTATVAGMLVDVRTGYIYGTTESTDIQEQRSTIWSTEMAIETARAKAERNAFEGFVGEFEELWGGVVNVHKGKAVARRTNDAPGERYYTIKLDGSDRLDEIARDRVY
jgi:predicted Zn-dependent protease